MIGRRIRLAHGACAALVILLGLCANAQSKEGGDQYPFGAENWLAGAVPPPGDYFLNYAGYYSGRLRDGQGHKVGGTEVGAWFDAMRYVHMTDHRILGGQWGWHAIVPVVRQHLDLGPGTSATQDGVGDITIDPFVVAWHRPRWHWAIGLDFNAPTGQYHAGHPERSIGANYWSVEPLFAVTYLGDTGWEVSAKFMYNIKTTNRDFRPAPGAPRMDYRSGDEFHMDYLVGRHFGPWGIGVSGYYLQQTTDDTLDGEAISSSLGPWSTGRRGRALAFGPSVNYTLKSGTQLVAQWQHETLVENRFGGDKFWLKLVMPL